MASNVTYVQLLGDIAALELRVAVQSSDYAEAMDNIFMLLSGYLVWVMSAGFCFLEMGSVRYKNSQNVLTKNIIAPVLAYLSWYVSGYALAFGAQGETPNKFIGTTFFALSGFWSSKAHFRHWYFQGAFSDTAPSIVSGGIAERMTLLGFVVHTIVTTGFIYPVAVYWAWSGYGWLSFTDGSGNVVSLVGPGFLDWAGSGVIHMLGGCASLCGAILVGPRTGRFNPDVNDEEFLPHSIPFTVLGTFILWFGWYGFNPGCTPSMHSARSANAAGMVAANSTLAPCAAGLVAFFLRATVFSPKRLDIGGLCNGILAGLVAITGPCGYVNQWESIIIGVIAGLLYVCNAALMPKLKIDDPIEAVSVHFVNGLWGAIATGFFGNPREGMGGNGVFYGGNQLGVQLVGILAICTWTATMSLLVWLPLRYMNLLRWSDDFQLHGSDVMQFEPCHSRNFVPAKPSDDTIPSSAAATPKKLGPAAAWSEAT